MKTSLRLCLSFLLLTGLAFVFTTDAWAVFTLTASPRRGGQSIRFEASEPGELLRNEEVTLTATSTEASQYQVYLTNYGPLTNELGNTLPQGAFVLFSPSNPAGTLRTQLETPVTMGQVPIYVSNAAGDSEEFVLVFNVHVPENQPGGVYHTRLTFTLELVNARGGVSPGIVNMDVRVEIRPSFRFLIQNVKGPRQLDFGQISKNRPAATETFKIEIESNIGTIYKIVQQLTEPLLSQDGVALEVGGLTFIATGGENGSLAGTGSPLAVSLSPTAFYTSGQNGGSDLIQIRYSLQPEPTQKAGLYNGNLSFKVESSSPLVPSRVYHVPVKIEIEPIFYLDMEVEAGGLQFGTFRTGMEKKEKQVRLTVLSNLGEPYQVTQIVSRKLTAPDGTVLPTEHFTYFGQEAQTGVLSAMSSVTIKEGETAVFTSDRAGTPEKFILNYSLTVPVSAKAGSYTTDIKYSITTL